MRFLVNHAVFALMVLPLLTVPERLCAQQETVTYRKNNEAIVANLDSADYVRVIRAPRLGFELPQLEEYYPNEQLKRKGNILDAESYPKFHGAVVEYYENGRKKSEAFYDEGLRVGQAKYYYRNGQLKKEMWHGKRPNDQTNEFTDVVTDTLVNYYDSLGTALVVNGAGYVREEIGKDFEEGEYRGGVRVGKWIGSFQKQRYTFSEQYENGVVVYGVSTDRQGNTFPYSSIQTPPQYNGGIAKLMALIGRKYRYPKAAIRGGIHGKVVLGFVVENDGSVNEIRVIHDLGYGTGEEGVRVLNKASKWKPGYKRGVPVRVAYSLPIRLISP